MSRQLRFFIDSAMRRFRTMATTGGMSQTGLKTKAPIDSERDEQQDEQARG